MFLRHLAVRMIFVGLLAMAATAVGLLLYDQLQPPPQTIVADRTASAPTGAPTPGPSDGKTDEPQTRAAAVTGKRETAKVPGRAARAAAGAAPQPTGMAPQPTSNSQPPRPAIDPEQRAAFRQAMSQARSALVKREFAEAKRRLKTAETIARDPADQAELERLDTLVGNLEEFWKGIRSAVAGLLPAEEILLGQMRIIVVEVDGDQLTLRSEGRNQTYRVYDLPRSLIEALAARGFAKVSSSKILLGTYMAMDPNGDRQRARQLWEQAGREGEDVRGLMEMMKDE